MESLTTDYTDSNPPHQKQTAYRSKKCDQKRNQNTRYVIVLMFIHRRVVRIGFDTSKSSYTDLPENLF